MHLVKKFWFVLTRLLLISICCLSLASQADTTNSKTAADFEINSPQLKGSLRSLQGKVVYVDFWASWCKPCRQSFPWMNDMQAQYADAGLQVIAINLDSDAELAKRFLAKIPATMPIVYDPQGRIASAYALIGMPSSYLIDKKGQIRFAHQGFFRDKQQQYEHEINTLLAEME